MERERFCACARNEGDPGGTFGVCCAIEDFFNEVTTQVNGEQGHAISPALGFSRPEGPSSLPNFDN